MIKRNHFLITFIFIVTLGLIAMLFKAFNSEELTSKVNNDKHQLIVSLLPQKQIVERIAGDNFVVTELIPAGFSPETYDPTVQDMKVVSQAEVYFKIGKIPFEETNSKKLESTNPSMLIVDTSANNIFREIEEHSHGDEDLGSDDETDHQEIDPHVWLAPRMVKKQAQLIFDTLSNQYPQYQSEFLSNYEKLSAELDALDLELAQAFLPIKGKTMLVYHPAFGYLARDYDFNQEHIEIEGKEPSISDLKDIITEAKEDDVRVIFVQKQFSQDSAQSIAQNINGVVVEVDPLDPNYFENMRNMAQTISNTLQ